MKKILLPLMAVAALLTACDEERYDAPQLQKGVTFTVPDFVDEAGTRVAVSIDNSGANFTWTEGDTLGVFPSNGYQTAFPISGGAGTNTAVFDGADWALRPNASYAAYYPFVPSMQLEKSAITVSYLGQTQDGNGTTAHLGNYDYLAAKYNTVSASGNVNFTLNHLGSLVRFQLTMPEADTYTKMTLSCEGSMLTTAGKFDLTAATPALTAKSQDVSISLALENVATTEANQVLTLYMMLPPMDLSGKNLSIKVSGETDYTATVAGKDMKAGSIYGYSNSMTQLHEYVDLGLSVLWATCNVGATQPEEYGDYFAWGETEPYYTEGHSQDNPCSNWKSGKSNGYDLRSYKYCNGSSSTITKYCISSSHGTVDNKTVLESADDAAAVNWGGSWRMPTRAEQDELQNNCTWTRTTKNGVNGFNVVGPNGNSIFLPAAGFRRRSDLNEAGSQGHYWSSSLFKPNSINAYYLNFGSGSHWGYDFRCYGNSVRPVCPNPNFIRATSIQITGSKTQLTTSETIQLGAAVAPSDATNASVTWSSSDKSIATVSADGLVTAVATGSATITATANDGSGVKGEYEITVAAPALMHNGHEYVDLGLTSNGKPIYWATCNVGATQPEEYGDYFAWGETEPYYTEGHSQDRPCSNWKSGKSGYGWASYKWCNGSETTMTKYCTSSSYGTVDNKTVLDAADDAATANWGGSWRMPTLDELTDLQYYCTWTWTSKNGVNGCNVVGPNGNSIFLPAAGNRYSSSLYDAGSLGSCWSSSLETDYSGIACRLAFHSGGRYWGGIDRYHGFSVRSVYMPNEVKVESISLSKTNLTLTEGGSTTTLTASVLPSNASNTNVRWFSSNTSIATVSKTGVVSPIGEGSCYITAITTDGTNLNANCFVRVNPITPDYNGHEYVDLGLPSGLMWATCNVGASKPEDYGDYFAWGETEPKLTYDISNYKYCNGSRSTLTKYCNNNRDGVVDNKTILESSDDAATANWGGSWRMPTDTEVTELITNCTWTRSFVNGYNGWNVSGNGNSIFLPVAGYRYNSWIDQEGSAGYYWLSSLCTDYSTIANNMVLSWTGSDIDYRSRDYAYPVRPVCSIAK